MKGLDLGNPGKALKKFRLSGARYPLRRKLLLLAGSVLFALFIVELSLRILGFSEPSLFYMYDRDRGLALRPSAEGWWHKENHNYVRISSQGLHDVEHTLMKPPGTLRIAVLGDSYAEALQVPVEDAFWAEMGRDLQQCPQLGARRVEVLNFGVSGYGTAQELITLRERVWDYSPDIVLLTFTTGNDVNDNLKALSQDTLRPYFVYRDGKLTLDTSMPNSQEASLRFRLRNSAAGRALDWLRQRLRILQLVSAVDRALAAHRAGATHSVGAADRTGAADRAGRADSLAKPDPSEADSEDDCGKKQPSGIEANNSNNQGSPSHEPGLDDGVYYEPVNETWKEGWHVTEGLISQMHYEVKSRGARFYVATLSSAAQVSPRAGEYEMTLQGMGLKDLFYPERRIRALGEREGFPVLNLAPLLKDYAEKQGVHLHGFGELRGSGHWNQTGHRVAGDMIAAWLCTESTH